VDDLENDYLHPRYGSHDAKRHISTARDFYAGGTMFDGSYGLSLIQRYAEGEKLDKGDMEAMKSVMYLISLYLKPQRSWEDFLAWKGPDHFIREIWPMIRDRSEIASGLFGHGAVSP
jgi:hypothetical protein